MARPPQRRRCGLGSIVPERAAKYNPASGPYTVNKDQIAERGARLARRDD